MTRDELEAIIAKQMNDENATSCNIIDTIFAALKEPTIKMRKASWNDAVTYNNPDIWKAMLNASPLAPKGK